MKLEQYGIEHQWIVAVKARLKEPKALDRVKRIIEGVTKEELQSRSYLMQKLKQIVPVVGISMTKKQAEGVIQFIIDQKIDPNQTWHLIKLWNLFRGY
jgi:hypothetical protein